MSLINQVLQDLQQRRAPGVDVPLETLRDVRVTPRRGVPARRGTWLPWALIGVFAAVSAALVWERRPAQPPASVRTPPVAAAATRPPLPVRPAPAPVPAPAAVVTPVPSAPVANRAPVAALPVQPAPLPHTAPVTIASTPPAGKAAPTVEKTPRPLTPEQRAELAYQDGMRLLQSGRPTLAEPRLRDALASAPDYRPARDALAALLINAQRMEEARSVLAQGLELAPNHAPFAKLYARLLIERGDLAMARGVLERAAPPVQTDPEYHALLAALYQRSGRYDQAAQSYRSVLQAQPGNGVWWLGLGMALEAGGNKAGALQAYQRAHASGTLTPEVLRYVDSKIAALD